VYDHQSQELLLATNTEEEVALDTASEANDLQRSIQEQTSLIQGSFIKLRLNKSVTKTRHIKTSM